MASPTKTTQGGARRDSASKQPADPAAAMPVFSMFPQHEPEPGPEPALIPVILPAQAAICALIVPIDTPAPQPKQTHNEPMCFGTVGTWQVHVAPIVAPPPPPMWAITSLETVMAPSAIELPAPPPIPPTPPATPPPPKSIAAPPIAAPTPTPEPPAFDITEPPPPIAALFAPAPAFPESVIPLAETLSLEPSPRPAELVVPAPLTIAPPSPARMDILHRPLPWQIATAIAFAVAIAAIAIPALRQQAATPLAIAAIGVVNAPAPLYLAELDSAGTLRLSALATITVPNGRDLQLWIIPPGEQNPTSLGVLPARGTIFTLPTPPAEGTRFVISMEPRGGATAGRITGQVLYGGTLANR